MNAPLRYTLCVFILAATAACAPAPREAAQATPEAARETAPALVGRAWRLIDFTGQNLAPLARTQPVTLRFEDTKLTGQAPCNQIGANYTLVGKTLTIGPVTATKKGCLDVLNLEAAYFEALATVNRAEIVDGLLRLHGRDVVLTYMEIVAR